LFSWGIESVEGKDVEIISWLDATLERNRSPRAESIMAEIHGVREDEPEDVPDTKYSMAEIASWIQSGQKPRTWRRAWFVR
jgi:hypothetical protein